MHIVLCLACISYKSNYTYTYKSTHILVCKSTKQSLNDTAKISSPKKITALYSFTRYLQICQTKNFQ